MRIGFIILLALQSAFHLIGFLEIFGISKFEILKQSISKVSGLSFLLTCLLFVTSLTLFLTRSKTWWAYAFLAIILSQVLIFMFWGALRYVSIVNGIILIGTLIAYSNYRFENMVQTERTELLSKSVNKQEEHIQLNDLSHLPPIIQKWLKNSGVIGKQKVSNVYLTQTISLKLSPSQTEWNTGTAEQYFTTYPPAFNWNIHTKMKSLLNVVGRDKFENGQGAMLIKLLGLIPVVDVKKNDKINQATAQRFLAEIVWFPTAALSSSIQWEPIDHHSAKGTLHYNGTKGSGIFFFDHQGRFNKFVAMRYKDISDTAPREWTVTATKIEERNGIKIPTECEASWKLNNDTWTWLKLKIKQIQYNKDLNE